MATKFKTTAQNLKKMVQDCANALLKANNTVTTLEIKNALRKQQPHIHWIQNTKNGVTGVSEWMIELEQEGNFSYKDLGTYRMYSAIGGASKVVKKVAHAVKSALPTALTATKRPVGRPRKTSTITPSDAVKLIASAGGRFFTVEFTEKGDGSHRKMNCVLYPGQTLVPGMKNVKVRETTKAKYTPADAIRSFDPKTLTSIKVLGNSYKVK